MVEKCFERPNDEQLLAYARAGSAAAEEELIERYSVIVKARSRA